MPDEFVNHAGEPTNAVYGFSGFLCSLLEQTAAEHVAVAFDESLTTSYRNEIYPRIQGQPRSGAASSSSASLAGRARLPKPWVCSATATTVTRPTT